MWPQAALGGWHALAVTEEGELYAWGGNENYQASETLYFAKSLFREEALASDFDALPL